MAKKSKKKGNASTISANSTFNDDTPVHQSLNDKPEISHQFKIWVDQKNVYSKLLKSTNMVLLHPSAYEQFQAPKYVIVKGKQDLCLCVPFPLKDKDIKRSMIVFKKGTKIFVQDEFVTLLPYNKCILEAANVTVAVNTQLTLDDDELKQHVLRLLRNKRYFSTGMEIKDSNVFFYNPFSFTITNILSYEQDTVSNNDSFNISNFKNTSTSFYSNTNVSLSETNYKKLLSSTIRDTGRSFKVNHSSSELHSMFSSMCLNDSDIQESKSLSEFENTGDDVPDTDWFAETNIPLFYTLNHKTSLTVIGTTLELERKPSITFSHIGGLKDELKCVKSFVDNFLTSESYLRKLGVLMLLGPSGTGKTLVLDAIQNEYGVHIEEVLWYKLYLKTLSDAEQELREIFHRASQRTPCIIIMDDFNSLCPKVKDLQSQRISRTISYLIENSIGKQIIIVVASYNLEYDAEVFNSGDLRIQKVIFRIPSMEEREEIFTKLFFTKQHNLNPEEIKQCVMHSQGFTGKDLNFVLNEAIFIRSIQRCEDQSSSENSSDEIVTFSDIKRALKYKKPSIVESNMKIKEVRWNDIGGMQSVKQKLKDIVEEPFKYPDIYKRFGIALSRGVLLFGPPGCSKTMIAKALATECNLNFISKNVSDIQNKYVGESEKAVHDLFQLAREKAPCIIFLDEVDALAADRGSFTGSGVEERIVNAFLKEMDGFEELKNVIIIAATNRPDRLDPAFTRPGRINHFIYVPLPDIEAREEILKLQMKNRTVAEDFDYKYLALKTEGYSGAEIVNICNEAAFHILLEDINCESCIFTVNHFINAIKSTTPRTPVELLEFYKEFNEKYG
ncbi:hypothetical protein JTE90_017520 [Oedothorax gibbosus]|uniref:AAA+ ATPase domain-containing protein n=1 Tax=Oedothorax gibbosus TaxID=931172 RepID=A0AAV6UC80_9ARAC|nr:hypothetical protein JTE90_017520 [Oedothorax gibbosus]